MNNTQMFMFKREAYGYVRYLVPAHASRCEIEKGDSGYWINVWWHCGIIAPLTVQEFHQALGENKC